MRLRPIAWLVLLTPIAVGGCGSDSDELSSPTAIRMKGLANLFMDSAVSGNGKGPASEQEFKKHLLRLPVHVLVPNGFDSPDITGLTAAEAQVAIKKAVDKWINEVFVSQRDQEPFVIRYGVKITQISGTSAAVVIQEKTGKNGKRLVAYANGKVELVDEAQFQNPTSAKQ